MVLERAPLNPSPGPTWFYLLDLLVNCSKGLGDANGLDANDQGPGSLFYIHPGRFT